MLAQARVVLRPELVNRVDEVVLFAPLSAAALRTITTTVLAETRERLASQGVGLVVSDAAVAWLADRAGGRHLGRRREAPDRTGRQGGASNRVLRVRVHSTCTAGREALRSKDAGRAVRASPSHPIGRTS